LVFDFYFRALLGLFGKISHSPKC